MRDPGATIGVPDPVFDVAGWRGIKTGLTHRLAGKPPLNSWTGGEDAGHYRSGLTGMLAVSCGGAAASLTVNNASWQ